MSRDEPEDQPDRIEVHCWPTDLRSGPVIERCPIAGPGDAARVVRHAVDRAVQLSRSETRFYRIQVMTLSGVKLADLACVAWVPNSGFVHLRENDSGG